MKQVRLQTDAGNEFLHKQVQGFLKREVVQLLVSNSDQKATMAERFNRRLMSCISPAICPQTGHYLDNLTKSLDSYKNTYHRRIDRAPYQVWKKDENDIWVRLYPEGDMEDRPKNSEAKKRKMLWISKRKGTFHKCYIPNWSA